MTLKEHIEIVRKGLMNELFPNEDSVGDHIVLPALHALGWPQNPQIITPRYSDTKGEIRYTLCHPPLEPLVHIKVKQIGKMETDDKDQQLLLYAFNAKVSIVIITSGQEWHFYRINENRDKNGDTGYLAYKLDLLQGDNEESTRYLDRYLNYESICNGEAIRRIEDDCQNITRAWRKLVQETDELLIKIVQDKTKNLYGYIPTAKQVSDFLQTTLKGVESHPREEPASTGKKAPQEKQPSSTRGPNTRLVVTMPNGEVIDRRSAITTFVEVIEKLGPREASNVCPNHVSPRKSNVYDRQVGQYYVKSQRNNPTKKQMLEEIASRLEIPLKVEITP